MRIYEVTLTGRTPLLMHHDNIEWSDRMEEWKNNPENKSASKAGDDRTPAWRWLGNAYHDGAVLGIPQGNIMRAIMEGGALVPVPGGRGGKTFKSQTQSGMMSVAPFWPILIGGASIPWPEIDRLKDVARFTDHKSAVAALGFSLLVKRAKIGQSKHIRVRPEFPKGWQLQGEIAVWDDQIDDRVLNDILTYAGRYKGLCDWRPGGKTPGPYGTFDAEIRAATQ